MPSLDRFKLPARARKVPRFKQPDGIRMRYYAELRPLLRRMRELVRERLVSKLPELVERHVEKTRLDAAPAGHRARALLASVSRTITREWPTERLTAIAQEMGRKTSDFQKAQLFAQVRSSIGIDIGTLLDKGIGPRIAQFAAENVSLIRTVQARYLSQVEQRVLEGISYGERAADIAADLEERYEVSESNALRIANDQIGKLTGQLNMVRQQQLGVDSFVWRTMHDGRVREEHQALDGKTFPWDDSPAEGVPGEPINCRCYAEPDLEGLLEE